MVFLSVFGISVAQANNDNLLVVIGDSLVGYVVDTDRVRSLSIMSSLHMVR